MPRTTDLQIYGDFLLSISDLVSSQQKIPQRSVLVYVQGVNAGMLLGNQRIRSALQPFMFLVSKTFFVRAFNTLENSHKNRMRLYYHRGTYGSRWMVSGPSEDIFAPIRLYDLTNYVYHYREQTVTVPKCNVI